MNKPIIIISERDYVEKKYEFYNEIIIILILQVLMIIQMKNIKKLKMLLEL